MHPRFNAVFSSRVARKFVLAAAAVVVAGPAQAQIDPAERCASSKLKASGKYAKSALGCHARNAGDAADPACLAKASGKLGGSFTKADGKGGCDSAADAATVEADLDAEIATVVATLDPIDDPDARRCASKKLKAAAKNLFSRVNCYAKAAKRGLPPDADCLTKAQSKMQSSFDKTDAKGGCTATDDAAAVEATVVSATTGAVASLSPICGDDIDGVAQSCDGSDDGQCPGECSLACACPPACGDGEATFPEECDDGDTASGDGCSATCQLEDASALCAGVPVTSGTDLAVELIGFASQPIDLTAPALDPNRLFVVERAGVIRIFRDDAFLPTPFLDISSIVSCCGGENGLLGLAFHPDYDSNGRFFVNYINLSGDTAIARYEVSAGDPDVADAGSGEVLFTVGQLANNHNGGQVAFGSDGYLYVGMGDGGFADDPAEAGQDPTTLLGKMLRVDVDVETSPFWTVPPDNPNFSTGTDPLELIWASGLRNPWRFSFDRATGDLYIADVGQDALEEVNYQAVASSGGENYGWDIFEGTSCFEPEPLLPMCPDPPTGYTHPVLEYSHSQGCSITGGHVYRGCSLPDLDGKYFYTDYCTPFVASFEISGGSATNLEDWSTELSDALGGGFNGAIAFGRDARGELYLLKQAGQIYKIVGD